MPARCSVFIDAGYLLASAATRVTGTSLRSGIHVEFGKLIAGIRRQAEEIAGMPVLRIHWYDSARNGVPDYTQQRIGELPRVKLRLGRFGIDGQQKGVDLRLGLDLVTHARNQAADVFLLVSGDDDLTEAVEEAQVHGVEVVLLAAPNAYGSAHAVSRHLLRAADELYVIDGALVDEAVLKVEPRIDSEAVDAVAEGETAQETPTPEAAETAGPDEQEGAAQPVESSVDGAAPPVPHVVPPAVPAGEASVPETKTAPAAAKPVSSRAANAAAAVAAIAAASGSAGGATGGSAGSSTGGSAGSSVGSSVGGSARAQAPAGSRPVPVPGPRPVPQPEPDADVAATTPVPVAVPVETSPATDPGSASRAPVAPVKAPLPASAPTPRTPKDVAAVTRRPDGDVAADAVDRPSAWADEFDATISTVVGRVLNSLAVTSTPTAWRALELGRPSIPREVDKALLIDVTAAMGVLDLSDLERHEIRAAFWTAYDSMMAAARN